MTSSQLAAPARTNGTADRRTGSETDIKTLWEPLLELLNGSPAGRVSRPTR